MSLGGFGEGEGRPPSTEKDPVAISARVTGIASVRHAFCCGVRGSGLPPLNARMP